MTFYPGSLVAEQPVSGLVPDVHTRSGQHVDAWTHDQEYKNNSVRRSNAASAQIMIASCPNIGVGILMTIG